RDDPPRARARSGESAPDRRGGAQRVDSSPAGGHLRPAGDHGEPRGGAGLRGRPARGRRRRRVSGSQGRGAMHADSGAARGRRSRSPPRLPADLRVFPRLLCRGRAAALVTARVTGAAALVLFLTACQITSAPPLFELRSPAETGIAFANTLREDDSVYNVLDFDYLYNGGGVAIADVNNDGLEDVYFAGNMVSSRLYLNRGRLRFEDVTEAAGVGTHVWVSGVTVVDINQDGLPDLYLSVGGPNPARRGNLLFVNQGPDAHGTPRFVEEAQRFGIADSGYNTHAVFFDYDRDGDLDLYVLKNALESH